MRKSCVKLYEIMQIFQFESKNNTFKWGDFSMIDCDCPICEDWKSGGKLYLAFFHHECKREQYYAKGEEEWLMKYKRK